MASLHFCINPPGLSPHFWQKILYPPPLKWLNFWKVLPPSPSLIRGGEFQLWLQVKVWSLGWSSIWFADWRTICRLTNCKSKSYSICRWKNYIQIEELSAAWRTICRLKYCLQLEEAFDLQIEESSADWGIICRRKNCLQTKRLLHW